MIIDSKNVKLGELSVIIRDRKKVHFEGIAKSVSSHNAEGYFDVMPEHASFIAVINTEVVVDKGKNPQFELKIDTGIIRVYMNTVEVFVGV